MKRLALVAGPALLVISCGVEAERGTQAPATSTLAVDPTFSESAARSEALETQIIDRKRAERQIEKDDAVEVGSVTEGNEKHRRLIALVQFERSKTLDKFEQALKPFTGVLVVAAEVNACGLRDRIWRDTIGHRVRSAIFSKVEFVSLRADLVPIELETAEAFQKLQAKYIHQVNFSSSSNCRDMDGMPFITRLDNVANGSWSIDDFLNSKPG